MSTRIIASDGFGHSEDGAVLFDSVSGWAFGPVFSDGIRAEEFLDWLRDNGHPDPRRMSDRTLKAVHDAWQRQRDAE